MSIPSNANIYQVPFEGKEPLGLISINIGEHTSTVNALSLYPGLTPFRFERKAPAITSVKWTTPGFFGSVVESQVDGLPLHLHPPNLLFPFKRSPTSPRLFYIPNVPKDRTIETIFTDHLSALRSSFDTSLQGFALWTNVKDRARVIFVHPGVWGPDQLQLLRKCIENAGWLSSASGGNRELEFITEEEAMISGITSSFLNLEKPLPKRYVVANECSPTTVAVSFLSWGGKWLSLGACNAGFTVAYEAAVVRGDVVYPRANRLKNYTIGSGVFPAVLRLGARDVIRDYKVCFESRQITTLEGDGSDYDIKITKDEGVESLKISVKSLVSTLASSISNMLVNDHDNTCIILGGSYIGSEVVTKEVHRQLSDSGVKCGDVLGPTVYCNNSVDASEQYAEGGRYLYLISRGLLKFPTRKPETDALKEVSIVLGDYWCYQQTEDGRPINALPSTNHTTK